MGALGSNAVGKGALGTRWAANGSEPAGRTACDRRRPRLRASLQKPRIWLRRQDSDLGRCSAFGQARQTWSRGQTTSRPSRAERSPACPWQAAGTACADCDRASCSGQRHRPTLAKQELQDEGQARRRLASLPHPACSRATPRRIVCFLTLPRRAKTDLVALCEGARAKGGGRVNLHSQA